MELQEIDNNEVDDISNNNETIQLDSDNFKSESNNMISNVALVIFLWITGVTIFISFPPIINFISFLFLVPALNIQSKFKNKSKKERLIKKQNIISKKINKTTIKNEEIRVDLIIQYKKLYDSGAITYDEFEKKKKELL